MTPLWAIRILFLGLCMTGGYAISQVRPEFIGVSHSGLIGMMMGFGFGGWVVAVAERLKAFSLRAFSAITFGLLLGMMMGFGFGGWMVAVDEMQGFFAPRVFGH